MRRRRIACLYGVRRLSAVSLFPGRNVVDVVSVMGLCICTQASVLPPASHYTVHRRCRHGRDTPYRRRRQPSPRVPDPPLAAKTQPVNHQYGPVATL